MIGVSRRSVLAIAATSGFAVRGQSTNPKQRGLVVHGTVRNYVAELKSWGANLVRYQLLPGQADVDQLTSDKTALYRKRILDLCDEFDSILPEFKAAGIRVILDLHHFPKDAWGIHQMFRNGLWANEFLDLWAILASRYKDNSEVYAFDLLNEPAVPAAEQDAWAQLATFAINRIRMIDSDRVVSFQPKNAEPRYFRPLARLAPRSVLYSLHMYQPMSFTHQLVPDPNDPTKIRYPEKRKYPGQIPGTTNLVDRAYLRNVLLPVQEFALRNKVGIYVGEFSFSQYSEQPSASSYLRDAISLFEEFNWRWTYHAYREHSAWEITSDGGKSLSVLKSYLRLNA